MAKTEKQDRRTQRTERNLREALLTLIFEKGYEQVTIQDIIDRADVGRSTFYAHFENKDHLHLSVFDEVRNALLQHGEVNQQNGKNGSGFSIDSLKLFQHANENRKIYRALAGRAAGNMFLRKMFREIQDLFVRELQGYLPKERKDSPEIKVAAHFYTSSLMAMLTFWLDTNLQLSPEEMNELFKTLVLRGLNGLPQLNLDTSAF